MIIFKNFNKYSYHALFMLLTVLIGVIGLWNIGMHERITVIDDQFGYWGISAHLAGYDWADLMSVTGYYSYGYSLILIPLYWLGSLGLSTVAMYKGAVVMNGLFLILSFILTVYMGKRIFPLLNKYYLLIISTICTLYISNVGQSGGAWPEVFLYFLFWCVTVCIYKVVEKPGVINLLLLILVTGYIFMVHMRALGVVVAVILVVLLYFLLNYKKVTVKQAITAIAAALLMLCIVTTLKEYVTHEIYQNNVNLKTNDFSGQTSMVKNTFSLMGVVDLLLSVLGKIYYLGVSSYLFVFIGFSVISGELIKHVYKMGKERKVCISARGFFLTFLILSFVGEVLICAVFKIYTYYSLGTTFAYADTIMFGRYTDFIIGPMLLFGFAVLPEVKKYIKEILFSLIVLIICAVAVQHQLNIILEYNDPSTVYLRASATSGIVYLFNGEYHNFAFYAAGIAIFIAAIIIFMILLSNKSKYIMLVSIIGVTIVGSIWTAWGLKNRQESVTGKIHKVRNVESVRELIEDLDRNVKIYYVNNGNVHVDIKILQWICYDKKIYLIKPEEVAGVDKDAQCLFISHSDEHELTGELCNSLEYIYNSGTLCIYAVPGSKTEADALDKIEEVRSIANPKWEQVDLSGLLTDLSYQKYNGNIYYNYNKDEGYLTNRTHLVLEDGIYEFVIEMEVNEYNGVDKIGYITVTNTEGSYLETRILSDEDFAGNGKGKIAVQIEVENYEEPVIGIYTYTNCAMKITGMKYHQIKGNVVAGKSDIEGIKTLASMIEELDEGDRSEIVYVDSDSSGVVGFPDLSEIEACFSGRKIKYVPGQIIPYIGKFPVQYLLIEKDEDNEIMNGLLQEYRLVGECRDYYAVMTD